MRMFRIDRTFKDRLVKWTIILSIILEAVMVVINFPDIWEILEYCGMGLVIIFFVILCEIRGIAFGIKYGMIQYVDSAKEQEQEYYESAEDILSKQVKKLEGKSETSSTPDKDEQQD